MTTVVETRSATPALVCPPATLRVGQLGLGNVGSALARLTREAADGLRPYGVVASTTAALVRTASRPRPAAAWVGRITDNPDVFFSEPYDVIVEAIGGIEPAHALVGRALDRGIPVVTANKSLVAAHGESLSDLARRRGTALRYEASCIAGVPFLGTFERRPLASRVRGLTAILNGTSNAILTAVAGGESFDAALREAQRLGLAEPDPTMDISGRDAAEKLALLIRRFARRIVTPDRIHTEGIAALDPIDLRAAATLGGVIRPLAHASWHNGAVHAFAGPAFLPDTHPLSRVSGSTNGILLDAIAGRQCFIGPGAGPDVTAVTLLDDVCEVATERHVRTPSGVGALPAAPERPADLGWFLRLDGGAPVPDTSELLGAYGVWCARLLGIGGRLYALTFPGAPDRVRAATHAVRAATGGDLLAIPVLPAEDFSC